jgi:lysophospholipase L1-like esterase
MLLAGCRSSTTPTPPPAAPVISCPVAATGQSSDGSAVQVSYPAPTVTGGTAPVTVTCTPSIFPVGTTTVTCTARDAKQQIANCAFPVSVVKVPQLRATRFVAFGDSITAGLLATTCPAGGGVSCALKTPALPTLLTPFDELRLMAIGEASSAAYPRQLQSLLASRFSAQAVTIVNEGNPGEFIADGKSRLSGTLTNDAPQVLLLQEGANDIDQSHPPISRLVNDLRTMVRNARGRGIDVFVGTVLPQRPNACRGYDFCDGAADSVPLNEQIRAMVASEDAVLVDLYPAFDGQTATLLGVDGLHPNEAGYQKIADLFFAAITQRLAK